MSDDTDDADYVSTVDAVQETTDATASGDGVYANAEAAAEKGLHLRSERGDTSDEVDPRKLVRDPTLSEIRWYYRRTFAKVLVDKPIDDAFKNGFDFIGDNEDEAREMLNRPTWEGDGDGFIGAYKLADKKARRDGFSLIFMGTQERGSSGINQSPIDEDVDVRQVSHLKVLTLDDLAESAPHDQIEEGTGLDHDQYEVRETGIVVNTDINSPDYRTPVGYVLSGPDAQFIHADRIIHLTWNPEVDGDYHGQDVRRWDSRRSTLGQYEGDSVLIPSYDILKGIAKGNWAVMQALFRNASHMYTVELPEDADTEDQQIANQETRNINAKSSLVFPHGYDVQQHESGGEMEVGEHFEVLFDQICAAHEMTKSVLFGTQSGTTTGSETDIKNYFNQVERYRTNRAETKIGEFLTRSKQMTDTRTSDDFEYDIEVEWGPMFKLDREKRVQMLQNEVSALTTAIGTYVMTPDEARELLTSEFTEIDLDDLTETQKDELDRIRLASSGQGTAALASEGEYTNAPEGGGAGTQQSAAAQGGSEGGREEGQTQTSPDPAADSQPAEADSLVSDSQVDDESDDSAVDSEETVVDSLERLDDLHDRGAITDDEYEAAKAEVLG